jgi:hypothetical protein
MSHKEPRRVFELRYQGEVVGWAMLSEHGCVLEAANEDLDAHVVHKMRGIVEWLVQAEAFAA